MDNGKDQPQLNKEQQAAAFCTENAVVAAGAGSGKTRVLANRFAWLLTEKGLDTDESVKIDEILTLTFTKKAAAEMFRRIHSLLTGIAENETGPKAEKARQALDDFIHARIQTLDSYSTAIVRQSASRYGISPDFTIDQERCRQIAMEESLPFLITHRHHPAVEWLYSDNRPNDIASGIFTDILVNYCQIDKPRDFTADVKTQFGIICSEWEKQRKELNILLEQTENLISEDDALLPDLVPLMKKYKKEKITIPDHDEIKCFFDMLLKLPSKSCTGKAQNDPLQKSLVKVLLFLSEICALKLNRGKRAENKVKENINKLRANFGRFSSLAVSCMQAGFIISVMNLLTQLQDRYLSRKRAEGVLTFKDVACLSRTILLEQHDIRQSEKESFKAIMIDEFQDNNELQKDLLFLLAEKQEKINSRIPGADDLSRGKLFFVGDEKQSIYLFRGADVSVFRRLKNEIKSHDLPLKINYRSSPSLIGAFNAIFGGSGFDPEGKEPMSVYPSVFAPEKNENPPLPLYEASYAPLEKGTEKNGSLSIYILNKNDDGGADEEERLGSDENEALFVAEKIQKLLKQKKYLPNDIAVLFRTRSIQYLFEKHLRLLGIPYSCEDVNDFFYGGPVNDIMSVLRLAAFPLDSASYAEMLRSPFAGLSLSAAALCLSIFAASENPRVFNDEPLPYLDETDKEGYLRGQKIYSSICGKAEEESISSLVSELWYKEGYRYETEWNPLTAAYRELYDYLFHLAVKADNANQGLAAFTDSMRTFRDRGGQLTDIEIPLEHTSAVHLMTIHKSKGLEFPVVFLCGCGKHSQTDRNSDVFFSNDAGVAFSAPLPAACYSIPNIKNNFFWEKAKEEIKLKRTAELRRLLYVGMTRAEKELHITGALEMKDDGGTDNFSLKVKNHIDKKCEKNMNQIYGDSIMDNDTFFGLLLPSVISRVPADGLKPGSGNNQEFFNLEEIPVYTEKQIKKRASAASNFSNDRKGLNEYIKKFESVYQKAEVIKTPVLRDNHKSAVSLKDKEQDQTADALHGKNFQVNSEYSGEKTDDVFKKVDSILEKLSKTGDENLQKFNSGSFGTIAHICVEACLNNEEPVIPVNITGSLSPAREKTLLEAGKELAVRFTESPLGKLAKSAKLRENEFSFRSLIRNKNKEEIFINGTVDLFFEASDSIHIVDFKTDSLEIPSEHIAQMASYYHAITELFAIPSKKECRVWLYYLRTGHAVEMTERVKKFNLELRAFS